MTLIIGLGHYARTGKDYFANRLIEETRKRSGTVRIERRAFADKLKDVAHQLYGWAGLREGQFYDTKEGTPLREVVLPELGKSPRQIWVDIGTPAIRQQVYDATWVDYVLHGGIGDLDIAVITDVRFPNEVKAIRNMGGMLIKIVREGYGPGANVADQALVGYDGWDYVIGRMNCDKGPSTSGLDWWARAFGVHFRGSLMPYQSAANRRENLDIEKAYTKRRAPCYQT